MVITLDYVSRSTILTLNSIYRRVMYTEIHSLKNFVVNFHTQARTRDYKFFKGSLPHGNCLDCYYAQVIFVSEISLVRCPHLFAFLIHQQLVRRSRARTLFMNYICIFCFLFSYFFLQVAYFRKNSITLKSVSCLN